MEFVHSLQPFRFRMVFLLREKVKLEIISVFCSRLKIINNFFQTVLKFVPLSIVQRLFRREREKT